MVRQNRKLEKPSRWSIPRSVVYPLGVSMGIVLCLVWTLEGTGLPQYWKMTQELDRTQEEIASLEQANTALREDIDLLESELSLPWKKCTGAVGIREGRRDGLSIR